MPEFDYVQARLLRCELEVGHAHVRITASAVGQGVEQPEALVCGTSKPSRA